MVLERNPYKNVLFQHSEILQISVAKFKNQNTIFTGEIATKFSVTNSKFKTSDIILICLEILLHKHNAVIKVPEVVK